MHGSRKLRRGGGGGGEGVLKPFYTHQRISQRAICTSFQKQLDPRGSIQLLLEGFRTIILRKPVQTCDFPDGGPDALIHVPTVHAIDGELKAGNSSYSIQILFQNLYFLI